MYENDTQNEQVMVENDTQNEQSVVENNAQTDKVAANWAIMRKRLDEAEARAAALERRAEEAERRAQDQRQVEHKQAQPEDDDDLGDDEDLVVTRKFKNTTKKIKGSVSQNAKAVEELRKTVAILEAKAEMSSIPDFNTVVSDENFETLKRLFPEDADSVLSNPNLKSRTRVLYNMIKKYGISGATPMIKQAESIRSAEKKLESNKMKPGMAATAPVSTSPITKFGRYDEHGRLHMTEEDAKRINEETRKKIHGY